MSLDKPLTKAQVDKLERDMPRHDPIADKMGTPVYRGSIEEIEEAKFPWLRKRRRQRRR